MKKTLSVRIDHEKIEKIRDIVYWNPGMSITSFIDMTLDEVVKKFHDVKARPVKNLKPGKKIS